MGQEEKKFRIRGTRYRLDEFARAGLPDEVLDFVQEYTQREEISVRTSGSTGEPKQVFLKVSHMRESARRTLEFLNLQAGDKCLVCLSPDYIAGMMMLVRWMEGDLDLYFTGPVRNPLAAVEVQIQFVAMVPYQVYHSVGMLEKVDVLLIGGGSVDPKLESQLRSASCRVYQSYGMTETITHIALREINPHFQQYYRVLEGVGISRDSRSCLVINAPQIGVNGLVTNDVVELKNSREFRWLGRHDNVVNSGGIKIFPEDVEAQLGDFGKPYILGGAKDEALGEKLVMVIESVDESDLEKAAAFIRKLPKYHRPREMKLLAHFAKTNSGKVKRHFILNQAFSQP